jgi:hypothetical protein
VLAETKRATTKICRINANERLIVLIPTESFVYRLAKELLRYPSHNDKHASVFKMIEGVIRKNFVIKERCNLLLSSRFSFAKKIGGKLIESFAY